jgi:hypothetical protein
VQKLRGLVAILWQENKVLRRELNAASKGGSSSMAKSEASVFSYTESVNYESLSVIGASHQEAKNNEPTRSKSKINEETRLEEIPKTESALLNRKWGISGVESSIEVLDFKILNKKSHGNCPRDFYLQYSIEVSSRSESAKIRLMRLHARASAGEKE